MDSSTSKEVSYVLKPNNRHGVKNDEYWNKNIYNVGSILPLQIARGSENHLKTFLCTHMPRCSTKSQMTIILNINNMATLS